MVSKFCDNESCTEWGRYHVLTEATLSDLLENVAQPWKYLDGCCWETNRSVAELYELYTIVFFEEVQREYEFRASTSPANIEILKEM
jgi:hypothetical protein